MSERNEDKDLVEKEQKPYFRVNGKDVPTCPKHPFPHIDERMACPACKRLLDIAFGVK